MAPDRYSWAHCNNSRGVSVIRKALMVGRGEWSGIITRANMCTSNGCCGGIIVAYDCWWVAPFVRWFGKQEAIEYITFGD